VGAAWRRQALSGPVWPSMVSDGAIGTSPNRRTSLLAY